MLTFGLTACGQKIKVSIGYQIHETHQDAVPVAEMEVFRLQHFHIGEF